MPTGGRPVSGGYPLDVWSANREELHGDHRGEYQDIAHPINNSTRKWMEDIVLAKYEDEIAKLKVEKQLAK